MKQLSQISCTTKTEKQDCAIRIICEGPCQNIITPVPSAFCFGVRRHAASEEATFPTRR